MKVQRLLKNLKTYQRTNCAPKAQFVLLLTVRWEDYKMVPRRVRMSILIPHRFARWCKLQLLKTCAEACYSLLMDKETNRLLLDVKMLLNALYGKFPFLKFTQPDKFALTILLAVLAGKEFEVSIPIVKSESPDHVQHKVRISPTHDSEAGWRVGVMSKQGLVGEFVADENTTTSLNGLISTIFVDLHTYNLNWLELLKELGIISIS